MRHERTLRVRDREACLMPHLSCLIPHASCLMPSMPHAHALNTNAGSIDATFRNEIIAAARHRRIEPMNTATESGVGITSFKLIFSMTGRRAYDITAPSEKPATAAIVACFARIE